MASSAFYEFLAQRQSASILVDPKPDRATVEAILQVGGTVPDHGQLRPYRFVVIEDQGRDQFAASMVDAAAAVKGTVEEKMQAKIKSKAFAAPMQLLIIFSPVDNGKIPEWEQMAAASCTGYALALAANALGFGAVWKSFAFDPGPMMKQLFHLKEHERVLGWVNVGTEKRDRDSGSRPQLDLKKHALFLK